MNLIAAMKTHAYTFSVSMMTGVYSNVWRGRKLVFPISPRKKFPQFLKTGVIPIAALCPLNLTRLTSSWIPKSKGPHCRFGRHRRSYPMPRFLHTFEGQSQSTYKILQNQSRQKYHLPYTLHFPESHLAFIPFSMLPHIPLPHSMFFNHVQDFRL